MDAAPPTELTSVERNGRLYAPAVCENCCAVFASTEVITENDRESSSYRRSAGPCPRCASRGAIPEWVFRFHAIASGATHRATPDQLHSVIQALRETVDAALTGKSTTTTTTTDLTNQLTGPWSGVALELRRGSADQLTAKLTFLLWIADPPARAAHAMPDPLVAQMSCAASSCNSRSGSPGTEPTPTDHPSIAVTEPGIRRAS